MTQRRIRRVSFADEIRHAVREQILSGELAPGERLTEQGIAEQMGTSAGPVREAFAKLAAEGLLISLPHRGTFVSSVSTEEARAAYDVRAILEPYAAECFLARMDDGDLQALEAMLDDYRAAAAKHDYPAMIPIDMRFHGYLFAHSGNPTLAVIWPQLEVTIRKFIVVAGPQYDRDHAELVRKHDELLGHIRRRDVKIVRGLLASHGEDLWRHLEKRDEPRRQRRANATVHQRVTSRS
jgi:DNA-binding GntR family transcriptional regulator